jgi:membrane protease YdiL (CAAX protease family)
MNGRRLRDPQLWWAVAAAPLAWLAGHLWLAPATDWAWPLHQPRDLLFLGLVYPVVEEVVFRGILQGRLRERAMMRRRFLGLSGANLLTSAVFTALHFLAHPPLAALAVLAPSLVFGHFRDRHGDLRAPIGLHMYYNIGYFWIFSAVS